MLAGQALPNQKLVEGGLVLPGDAEDFGMLACEWLFYRPVGWLLR
jgi:hypothetical protein